MGKARTVMGAAVALAVGTVLLTGCSGSGKSDAASTTESTTTAKPTTSLSTTSTVPQVRAAALPPCPAGATLFTTLPDWLTSRLPAGTTLAKGATTGTNGLPEGTPVEVATVFVGPKEGEQLQTLTVYRRPGSGPVTFEWDPSVPKITTVRGRPGTIAPTVSRSGAGPVVASWNEDGAAWTASSSLGVEALAKVLDGLDLSEAGVTDPSGSFQKVGSGPTGSTGPQRVTELQVRTAAASPAKERVLYVRIDPARPGTTGPTQVPAGGVASTIKVDSRVVLLNPFQATASTDDGSAVEIRSYDGESQPATLDRAALTAILTGLHRRSAADAKVVDQLPLGDAGPDGAAPPGFCRED